MFGIVFFGLWAILWLISGVIVRQKKVKQPFAWGFMISMVMMLPASYFLLKSVDSATETTLPLPQTQTIAPTTELSSTVQSSKNITTAHDFAQKIYQKINEDNTYIVDAYQHGEKDTLIKLTVTLPQRATGSFEAYGNDPESTLAPYYACDNAYVELQSLLFDYSNDLVHNNADTRKQIRYRKARFDEQFAKCKARVDMTPEQASADYQRETNQ